MRHMTKLNRESNKATNIYHSAFSFHVI